LSGGSELKSPAAKALRAAGYLPLPRLWVTRDQMDAIAAMAKQNADAVNAIRAEASEQGRKQREIEAAWRRMKEATHD